MAARPTPYHQHFVSELMVVLKQWVREHSLGRVLFDTLMKLDVDWTPAPDLVFLAVNHLHRVKRKRIVGPVDLAVEVLSPSDKRVDRKTKFDAYARFGIPAYWIVDLDKRVLDEYELGKGVYSKKVIAPFDRPFAPRIFPGLRIDLASLEW
jgi:Uma2 family endonuclease